MSQRPPLAAVWVETWLRFWFDLPARNTLALIRIGAGMVLFYSLFIYSFDLINHLAPGGWAELAEVRRTDPMAWPFSLFDWVDAEWWLWTVHFTAMFIAAALVLGVVPFVTGPLALLFYLSYGHRNPAVMVGLDDLIVIALIYLSISPCAEVLTVIHRRPKRRRPRSPTEPDPQPFGWGGFVLRVLQIHVCLLYFVAALSSLFPEWLSGEVLIHPRLLERGLPLGADTLIHHPMLGEAVARGLTLLALFYGVLVWLPRFRYPVVALMVTVHVVVGIMWGLQAHNMMMIVLNLAFIDSRHLGWLGMAAAQLAQALWQPLVQRP